MTCAGVQVIAICTLGEDCRRISLVLTSNVSTHRRWKSSLGDGPQTQTLSTEAEGYWPAWQIFLLGPAPAVNFPNSEVRVLTIVKRQLKQMFCLPLAHR